MATPAERQRAFKRRRNDAGLVRVAVWVPREHAERVRKYAAATQEIEMALRGEIEDGLGCGGLVPSKAELREAIEPDATLAERNAKLRGPNGTMNTTTQPGPLEVRLSDLLGMRVGVRYVVTRDSKNREFQTGDRVRMEPDGSITCPAAQGWVPPEDVIAATEGWAIEPDANFAAAMRADLERKLATLPHA